MTCNKMSELDVASFVKAQVKMIEEALGNEKALIAVSGGVDSTVSAILTHKALGDNLICAFIDDNFMRLGEPDRVKAMLSAPPLNLPVGILNERERFMKALKGLVDAEDKRKAFRETFYQTLSDAALAEECKYLVQGTIKADIEETQGGIKTQHNILEQIGINPVEKFGYKVIEPIKSLYKYQVREVARYLGAPEIASERQPFPGPGLSVRVVGEITDDKLDQVKVATSVVEESFLMLKPAQYFTAILSGGSYEVPKILKREAVEAINREGIQVYTRYLSEKATGIVEGNRAYGLVSTFKVLDYSDNVVQLDYEILDVMRSKIQESFPEITRVLYQIGGRPDGEGYIIAMRSVETQDFLTAEITEVPWDILISTANKILTACPKVDKVYYDITPKPPATVEYE